MGVRMSVTRDLTTVVKVVAMLGVEEVVSEGLSGRSEVAVRLGQARMGVTTTW